MLQRIYFFIRNHWLNVLVGLALALALLYVEEDWRGAHAWAATKAEWEAKGESFDRAKFVPPPVPDEQNLATLPLFKQVPVVGANGKPYPTLVALQKATYSDSPKLEIPELGKWAQGELPDMAKIRSTLRSNFGAIFKDTKMPDSPLAQFDMLYPFLDELRAASATRPFYRFNMDYTVEPPYSRALGPITYSIKISKLLTFHAVLALHEHRGDLAIADLKLNQIFFNGAQRDPSLVGGLVAIGVRAIGNVAIYDGLVEHLWNDAQLVEIEELLKPVEFLTAFQFATKTEVLFSIGTLDALQTPAHRDDLKTLDSKDDASTPRAAAYFPVGWWDDNRRQIANYYFPLLGLVDPQARRVFPDIAHRFKEQNKRAAEKWDAMAPWNCFYTTLVSDVSVYYVEKFAQGQVSVDETRIACALERFHLAHGVYPATLAELAPACIDEVPHDIMNGDPYHYRLNADGTFLLYSVGWNQADDGGTVAFNKYNKTSIDYENGDWVWPTAKR